MFSKERLKDLKSKCDKLWPANPFSEYHVRPAGGQPEEAGGFQNLNGVLTFCIHHRLNQNLQPVHFSFN